MYDIIIIGSGPAGYSAAIFSARFNLKTLLIGEKPGGYLSEIHQIENYPGYVSISGLDLMKKFIEHVKSYKVPTLEEEVIGIEKKKDYFLVKTSKREYESKVIILATGTHRKELGIKGEREFKNKGVSYCALCDGPIFADKTVAVIGGSDSAAKEALFLSEYAKKVYIIYRKEKVRAEPMNLNLIKKNKKIEIINNTNITEIKGKSFVNSVLLDTPYKNSNTLKVDGVFIEIGHTPGSELAKKLGVKLNDKEEVITDKGSKTNVKGIFAAGDITDRAYKQVITAVADGVNAVFSAYSYLQGR